MKTFVIIIHLAFLSFFAYTLWKRQAKALQNFFWPALSAKVACGIFLGLLYFNYYQVGDTLSYFKDGQFLSRLARNDVASYFNFLLNTDPAVMRQLNFVDQRAIFFDKITSLVSVATYDNYWLISVYMSLASFLGAWYLVRKLHTYLPAHTNAAAISFLLFPSVVFWTSGLIKETIASSALFFLTGLFLTAWFEKKVRARSAMAGLLAIWVLWGLKYYYVALFVPVAAASLAYKFAFVHLIKPRRTVTQVMLWMVVFLVPLAIITMAHPNFYLNNVLDVIVSNYETFRMFSNEEDLIEFYALEPTAGSVLKNSPVALLSGLFRPFILEAGNALQIAASIENFIVLVITLTGLKGLLKIHQEENRILITALLVYVVLLCILLTLSTPNFGTLSRYRIGYMPYFLFAILCSNSFLKFLERKFFSLGQSG